MTSITGAQARLMLFVEIMRRRLMVSADIQKEDWRGMGPDDLMTFLVREATRLSDLLLVPERMDVSEVIDQCACLALDAIMIADSMRGKMGSADDTPSPDPVEEMKRRCAEAVKRHLAASGPVGEPAATLRYVLGEIEGL